MSPSTVHTEGVKDDPKPVKQRPPGEDSGEGSNDSDESSGAPGGGSEDTLTEGLRGLNLDPQKAKHFELLCGQAHDADVINEILTAPVFTEKVRQRLAELDTDTDSESSETGDSQSQSCDTGDGESQSSETGDSDSQPDVSFKQYGLMAGDINGPPSETRDPRIFYNVAAPSSTFICGSQGSGKSHTLSCLLENALISSEANVLPNPLTGLVFHYDTFVSDAGGSPCEAAYLSSHEDMCVRVLCAPTNIKQIRRIYKDLPNVTVEELRINEQDLNTKRMDDLMAVSSIEGSMPLYLHVVKRILREMRLEQQDKGGSFNYAKFENLVDCSDLKEGQLVPLQQRLDTLESFMNQEQVGGYVLDTAVDRSGRKKNVKKKSKRGNNWEPKVGQLTIVDLSCPCITAEMACSLFGICLSLFLEQASDIGKIVALDEAHKYMKDTAESMALTESLLSTIRLQRHLGARVIISTQEPTVSTDLLDLCTVTIVHRFSSPAWMETLRHHLAGASKWTKDKETAESGSDADSSSPSVQEINGVRPLDLDMSDLTTELFSAIVSLRPGEALLFSPSAVIDVKKEDDRTSLSGNRTETHDGSMERVKAVRLGNRVLKVRIRQRITKDGGRSIMAN